MYVFSLLSAIKAKLVDIIIMQSNYLCVILDVKGTVSQLCACVSCDSS